jgi:hypothetical protein
MITLGGELTEPETERRRSMRFQMELPITVKMQDGADRKCVTRDVSAGGVFFFCDFGLTQNSPIQLVMILPPEITGAERQWVCCHGRVVRVMEDSASGQHGIAVKVERFEMLPEIAIY